MDRQDPHLTSEEDVCCSCCFNKVSEWFQHRFKRLGEFIGSYPLQLIAASLIVCGALGVGMMRLSSESDIETLYTPVGSRASKDRVKLQEVFPDKTGSNYVQHSLTKMNVYGDAIFSSLNVLSRTSLTEIKHHVEFIKSISFLHNGTLYTYDDVCARAHDQCAVSGEFVLSQNFWDAVLAGKVTYPLWKMQDQKPPTDLSKTFGKTNTSEDHLTSAEYIKLRFPLRQDTELYETLAMTWEDEFIKAMTSLKTEHVSVFYASSQSLNKELGANTRGDIKYFSVTFTLMITYATLVAGGDMVSSRTWASWAGVMAAGMGIISAFGLVSACGMKFVNIVGVTPFLVIGIGVDDMFLLMSSWAETYSEEQETSLLERRKKVIQRMGRTFASAGIGITITSLTNLLAFGIGASSIFISVRNFCVYTGVAVIFCYLYQVFFFGPCLALHGRRVAAKRHCVTCFKVKSREEYREGGRSRWVVYCCGGKPPTERGDDERFCETLPRTWLPKILLNVPGKVIVILLFLAYLGVSTWGTYNLRQGLDLKNLVSKTSYFHSYTDVLNTHFENVFPVPFVFGPNTDYLDPDVVSNINTLLNDSKTGENATEICWLNAYKSSQAYSDGSLTAFVSGLQRFLLFVPVFKNDIVFSEDNRSIEASRCYLFFTNEGDSNLQASAMTRIRTLADESPLDVYVFHPAFIFYEQYVAILPSTLQTVGIALIVMTVITFIFLPHPLLVLLVVINIVSIILGIFGFLYFWNLSLSSITMIHLIMSVGFSVDFSVHVCSAFMLGEGQTRKERAESAIVHAAGPIFNGGLSSFLGMIILVFSKSYIFQSFFNVMLTVLLFGILHAVFLLPVVLSTIGPMGRPARPVSPLKSNLSDKCLVVTADEDVELKKVSPKEAEAADMASEKMDETKRLTDNGDAANV